MCATKYLIVNGRLRKLWLLNAWILMEERKTNIACVFFSTIPLIWKIPRSFLKKQRKNCVKCSATLFAFQKLSNERETKKNTLTKRKWKKHTHRGFDFCVAFFSISDFVCEFWFCDSFVAGLYFIKQKKEKQIFAWLILPVVICLSKRLNHACQSITHLYEKTANISLNQQSFIWS